MITAVPDQEKSRKLIKQNPTKRALYTIFRRQVAIM